MKVRVVSNVEGCPDCCQHFVMMIDKYFVAGIEEPSMCETLLTVKCEHEGVCRMRGKDGEHNTES